MSCCTVVKGPYLCVFQLGDTEQKDYSIDLVNHLTDNDGNVVDAISSVVWSAEPNTDIELYDPTVDGTVITVWARTPKACTGYCITATITTNLNRVIVEMIGIGGVSKCA